MMNRFCRSGGRAAESSGNITPFLTLPVEICIGGLVRSYDARVSYACRHKCVRACPMFCEMCLPPSLRSAILLRGWTWSTGSVILGMLSGSSARSAVVLSLDSRAQQLVRWYADKEIIAMDFEVTYTPEQEAFRAEVRAWLIDHIPEGLQ